MLLEVDVQLKDSSQPVKYKDVRNTYQKGDMFCIYCEGDVVYKHPIETIWRVVETYGYHGRKNAD